MSDPPLCLAGREPRCHNLHQAESLAIEIALGVGIGSARGIVIDNLGFGIALGIGLGIALAIGYDVARKERPGKNDGSKAS